MDSVCLHQNGDSSDANPVQKLFLPEYDNSVKAGVRDNIFGEPKILPRIGDEYQVVISQLSSKPNSAGNNADYWDNFFHGLPIPLMRIKTETSNDSCCLVPGLSSGQWTDAEKASFLLGLYIFQKNFVQMRRFLGNKGLGAILSFYYEEVYGSDLYRRWSEGRKRRSNKNAHGAQIFSGSRQQELLSRVLPTLSEDTRDALLEDSKKFCNQRMSLADYVFSLKMKIGMKKLVEAIGIGTMGKQDLTRMVLDPPSRSNQKIPITAKACSSLTRSEIIKLLIGDYRLSKARSNDLFWEAVWPRLLAKGWNSEQPGSKSCLVFLAPGVTKFSRRKLVKGIQYFDSTADVLKKVAKEPTLIELDIEQDDDDDKKKRDDNDDDDVDDDPSSKESNCSLQPLTPICDAHTIAYMVVDTSLPGGKVRELIRGLPNEKLNLLMTSRDSFEDMLPSVEEADLIDSKSQKDLREKKKSQKISKSPMSRKVKRGNSECIAPVPKRCQAGARLYNRISNSSSSINANSSSITAGSYEDKLSSASSAGGSPDESIECATKTRTLFDLNLPPILSELESDLLNGDRTCEPNGHCSPSPVAIEDEIKEQQHVVNSRRHGTRNRPPTTRALEALADGYLTVNRRRKSKDGEIATRPSRRPQMLSRTGEAEI